jgi:DNA repair protein RecO (recombination protein O)
MQQLTTKGIILTRTDFGEADRIITVLTPDYGKLRLMARGVRRVKSKLAGGIELFSVSDITFIRGRGEIGTLISARLRAHYGRIVTQIARVQLGYELIKLLNRITEDETEPDYFALLEQLFATLDDTDIPPELIECWFYAQILRLGGSEPNLRSDTNGQSLSAEQRYQFSSADGAFVAAASGQFGAEGIKFLRLVFAGHPPKTLQQVQGLERFLPMCVQLVRSQINQHTNAQ